MIHHLHFEFRFEWENPRTIHTVENPISLYKVQSKYPANPWIVTDWSIGNDNDLTLVLVPMEQSGFG